MLDVAPSIVPVIGFLDVDGYETQLYQRDLPRTRFMPCIVINGSGRLVSVSPEAKQLGISRHATPNIRDVRKLVPFGVEVFRKPDEFGKPGTSKTRHGTWQLLDAVVAFCSKRGGADIIIELASSDEIYLDLTDIVTNGIHLRKTNNPKRTVIDVDASTILESGNRRRGPFQYMLNQFSDKPWIKHAARNEERLVFGALFMRELTKYLWNKVEMCTSTGVATNKLMAKVGCGLNKPYKTTIITEAALPRISRNVSLSDIPGLGGKLGKQLTQELFVTNLFHLRHLSLEQLETVDDIGDMAIRVFSWARGRDNTPVIHKIMKHVFRCGKPSKPDISSIDRLRTAIVNLCAECACLLSEEKLRHKRIITSIKVEFEFESDESQRHNVFDVDDYDDLTDEDNLPTKILQHIIDVAKENATVTVKDNVKAKKFKVDTLTFVVKDFVPGTELPLEVLQNQLAAATPRVQDLRVQTTITALSSRFTAHRIISSFATTDTQGYYWNDTPILPKIISPDQYQGAIGSYLGKGFREAKLIYDHLEFYELKHKQFALWLNDFEFAQKIRAGQLVKPDFVCFNGRITDTMMTPDLRQFGDWEIYGMNVSGIIFLWDEKKPKSELTEEEFYGLGFESLLHDRKDENVPKSEFEHVYSIGATTFGAHHLLVVSDIDGRDESNNMIELRLMNQRQGQPRMSKTLKLWTSNTIANVDKLLIGIRDNNGFLVDILEKSLADLEAELDWRVQACLHFQDRLFTWMKSHLEKSNRDVVLKYSWVCGDQKVTARMIPSQQIRYLVLPRLYDGYLNLLEAELSQAEAEIISAEADQAQRTLEHQQDASSENDLEVQVVSKEKERDAETTCFEDVEPADGQSYVEPPVDENYNKMDVQRQLTDEAPANPVSADSGGLPRDLAI